MPKNVHFPRNFEKRDETRNRHEKREVQNCREPGKFSSRDETRDKHYALYYCGKVGREREKNSVTNSGTDKH